MRRRQRQIDWRLAGARTQAGWLARGAHLPASWWPGRQTIVISGRRQLPALPSEGARHSIHHDLWARRRGCRPGEQQQWLMATRGEPGEARQGQAAAHLGRPRPLPINERRAVHSFVGCPTPATRPATSPGLIRAGSGDGGAPASWRPPPQHRR